VRYNSSPVRRFFRILLNATTILSLLLCLAFGTLWVRGYWRVDVLGRHPDPRTGARSVWFEAWSAGGGVATYFGVYSSAVARRQAKQGWYWNAFEQTPVRYARRPPAGRWGF
jgi:hypothetical protein